jgi:SlyX protein
MKERLVELEVRVAFQDQTIQQLNEAVTSQQAQIDRLVRELVMLKSQLTSLAPALVIPQEEEKPPPHY